MRIIVVILVVLFVFIPTEAALSEQGHVVWEGKLRPTDSVHQSDHMMIPFYQAVPVAKGALSPEKLINSRLWTQDGRSIPAVLSPLAHWPDGSLRLFSVEGLLPGGHEYISPNLIGELPVYLKEVADGSHGDTLSLAGPVHSISFDDQHVFFLNKIGDTVVTLTPRASYIQVTEPKEILPLSDPDDERQYAWAIALEQLNPGGEPIALTPRIRQHVIERETDLFTVHVLRGDGGETQPGSELEWQLRIRLYRHTPIVRVQMTWGLYWSPREYALTQAEWVAHFESRFRESKIPGMIGAVNLCDGHLRVRSDPTGRSDITYERCQTNESVELGQQENPDDQSHVLIARSDGFVGLGVPNLTRLGPNHIDVSPRGMTLASWSRHSKMGLDLRSTIQPDEYGLTSGDGEIDAIGVARTLEASFVWGEDVETVATLAAIEARRDGLWFPSREDLVQTGALGSWSEGAFDRHSEFFHGLHANLQFIVASRDYWRWNGWANFGDVRTNFATRDSTEKGFSAYRWTLYGRYGWRNGSGDPNYGMWLGGLALEQRGIALAALDYALHVVDVDVVHESLFSARQPPQAGGMHRRNKDHWSGRVEPKYTPSRGLYVSSWLTGHERLGEVLGEIRRFAARNVQGSTYSSAAWINRYIETHDDDDLIQAVSLLDEAVTYWLGRGAEWGLSGLASLNAGDFRRTLDAIPVITEFYEATEDPIYLDAILKMMQTFGLPDTADNSLAEYFGIAYLLANGLKEDEIGLDLTTKAKAQIRSLVHPFHDFERIPPESEWDYDTLMTLVTSGSKTAFHAVGDVSGMAAKSPLVLRFLGIHGESTVPVDFPNLKEGMTLSKELLPLHIALVHPEHVIGLEYIQIDIDSNVIYSGAAIPEPGTLFMDTSTFGVGKHTLTISGRHREFGSFEHVISFNVIDPGVLFQDDFTEDEVGEQPSKWDVTGNVRTLTDSTIVVVEDPELDSKRALRVVTPVNPTGGNLSLVAELSVPHGDNPATIAIDYKFKLNNDAAAPYVRVHDPSQIMIQWDVRHLEFRFASRRESRMFTTNILKDTWYHVRVVLNREDGTAILYFDDMDQPVASSVDLYGNVTTWDGTMLSFKMDTPENSPGQLDVSYGEVVVRQLD